MGLTYSSNTISAEQHETQVRTLRNRNERRQRELIETWQARYNKLDNENAMIKNVAGVCAVVAGLTIVGLTRNRGGTANVQKIKSALQEEASLIRRTAKRDVAEATTKSIKALSKDLLLVVDEMDLAVHKSVAGVSTEAMKEGVSLVHQNMLKVLEGHGVRRLEAMEGMKFDPMIHEAVSVTTMEEEEEEKEEEDKEERSEKKKKESGNISFVAQEGYTLNDIVLRASRVGVYKKAE